MKYVSFTATGLVVGFIVGSLTLSGTETQHQHSIKKMINGDVNFVPVNEEWIKITKNGHAAYVNKDMPFVFRGDVQIERIIYDADNNPHLLFPVVANRQYLGTTFDSQQHANTNFNKNPFDSVETPKAKEFVARAKKLNQTYDTQSINSNGDVTEVKKHGIQWDCDYFFCKDGDPKVYPLPSRLAVAMGDLPAFVVGDKNNTNPEVEMVAVFDPDCAYSRNYFKESLIPLIRDGLKVRVVMNSYKSLDKKSTKYFEKVDRIACDANPSEALLAFLGESDYQYNQREGVCGSKVEIAKAKEILGKFNIANSTPLSLTKSSFLVGKQSKHIVQKHIELSTKDKI